MPSRALALALTLGLVSGGCTGAPTGPEATEDAARTTVAPQADPTSGGGAQGTATQPGRTTADGAGATPPASDTSPIPAATAPPPAGPPPCPRSDPVAAAAWTEAEGGRSLAVTPGEDLRACAGALLRWEGAPPGWEEVVALAGAEADSPAMEQQYVCHLRFARAKETWNLEPWRPAVDEETLLRARCNP